MSRTCSHYSQRSTGSLPAAGIALLISSCAPWQQQEQVTPALPPAIHPASRLVQMKLDGRTEFGLCTPPACPTLTAKTLVSSPPPVALPPAATSGTTAFPSVAKEIKASSAATGAENTSPFRADRTSARKTVTVHFGPGNASLSGADKVALNRAVAATPDARLILIAGRTDSTGAATTNEQLAVERARGVMNYLRAEHPGLAPVLQLEAQGSCCYVASNSTKAGRGLNRRVEIVFSADGEAEP